MWQIKTMPIDGWSKVLSNNNRRQTRGSRMKEMEIKVKDEISEEFEKFMVVLLRELPAKNIRCVANGKTFLLPLPDGIDENLIKERITRRYGSKVKIRLIEK
jgi:hypothetical protein